MDRTTILGKNGEPLTDAEVDEFLKTSPPTDTAALERIKAKFDALIAKVEPRRMLNPYDLTEVAERMRRKSET